MSKHIKKDITAGGMGAALDMPILFSDDIVNFFSGYLIPEEGWARFYVAIFAFMLPMPIMVLCAGIKA